MCGIFARTPFIISQQESHDNALDSQVLMSNQTLQPTLLKTPWYFSFPCTRLPEQIAVGPCGVGQENYCHRHLLQCCRGASWDRWVLNLKGDSGLEIGKRSWLFTGAAPLWSLIIHPWFRLILLIPSPALKDSFSLHRHSSPRVRVPTAAHDHSCSHLASDEHCHLAPVLGGSCRFCCYQVSQLGASISHHLP